MARFGALAIEDAVPLSRARRIVNRTPLMPCADPALDPMLAAGALHAMPMPMTDERLIAAIGRLEQEIARLERRLPAALAPASAAATPLIDADADLRQRHAALRAQTSATVERLSQLLDTAGER